MWRWLQRLFAKIRRLFARQQSTVASVKVPVVRSDEEYFLLLGELLDRLVGDRSYATLMAWSIQRGVDLGEVWRGRLEVLVGLGKGELTAVAAEILGQDEVVVVKRAEVNSDDAEAWFDRGNSLFSEGRYEEAIESYDLAITIYQNIIDHANDPSVAGQQTITPTNLTNWEKDLKAQGTWQGGEIYELWVDRATITPQLADQIAQTPHILIWLMPANLKPANAYQQASQSYQDLLYLCRYRHKILAAAHSSNACSTQLKQDYSQIIGYLQQMHQGIMTDQQLQKILVSLTDFTYRLDLLKSQGQTIQTNRDNYLQRLETIQAKAGITANLAELEHFITNDRYTPKYQKQIAADYEQLAPSREILQILSQTVQGHIQIRQTQVDRTTNITIASIATGIAASQVLSAVITTYPKKRTELPISQGFITDTWQYTPILLTDPTLYVSLTLSVFFGVLMFMLLRWFPHWWGKLFAPKRRY